MASYFKTYVDESRLKEGTPEEAWMAARTSLYICQQLCLQDTSRKRRMAGKYGGLKRGTKVKIIDGSVYQLIGERKWTKTQIIIEK